MFDHCLYFNATALARIVEREWTAAYEPFGLTPQQGFVLRAVLKTPGMLNREIASLLCIARPTATRVIDGLLVKQLIARRPSTEDGREWHLFPTQAALAIDEPINAVSAALAKRLRAQLGAQVFDNAIGTLGKVRRKLT
jgi:DNA-binding MarR family transcriptional regulator